MAPSALRHVPAHLCFWSVAGVMLVVDLWSKAWVFRTQGADELRTFVPQTVIFQRSLNDGAVFGSFTGYVGLFVVASILALGFVFFLFSQSGHRQRILHIALALILSGALGNLYDRAMIQADIVTLQTASGARASIIGHIVGNADDDFILVGDWPDGAAPRSFRRSEVTLRRQGVVRDFIRFVPRFPGWVPMLGDRHVWPWIFNVADASLVCGVLTLLIHSWVSRKRHHPAIPAPA